MPNSVDNGGEGRVDKEEDSRNPVMGRCYSTSQCILVKQLIVLDSSGGVGKV